MIQTSFLNSVLDPVFAPLLNFGILPTLLVICTILTIMVTLIYKLVTKQEVLKVLKEDLKKLQEDMKALKDKPEKMMKKQKELMAKNGEYMKHSFRATLFTIIPVIIIFGWLSANLAFVGIIANEEFNITLTFKEDVLQAPILAPINGINVSAGFPKFTGNKVVFELFGESGVYDSPPLRFEYQGENCDVPLIILDEGARNKYAPELVKCDSNYFSTAQISYEKIRPLGGISLFGWKPTWFGTYIILSILLSMIIRKLFKVY